MGVVADAARAAAERGGRAGGARAGAFAGGERAGAPPRAELPAAGAGGAVRRAAWHAREPDTVAAGVEEASRVASAGATPTERFTLACVMLRAPSRFARASALAVLDDLVAKESPLAHPDTRALASRALRTA